MKKLKTHKGITIIALIITIIVLLILAVVAIAAVQDGGILEKLQEATEKHEKAEVREEVELALADAYVANKTEGTTIDTYFNDKEGWVVNGNKITYKGYTFTVEDFKITDVTGDGIIPVDPDVPVIPTPTPTITLSEPTITLKLGETTTATIEATLANGEGTITWDSSEESVATLDKEEGTSVTVTAVAEGETTITATYGEDTTATCIVTVEAAETPAFNPSTLAIGTATRTEDYGKKVTNYTKVATVNGFTNSGEWRLFYQDVDFTYLITDDLLGVYTPSNYYAEYESGADVSTVGQKLSPGISSLFTKDSTSVGMRAAAWLNDTSKWEDYGNTDVSFALGSPTLELFAASCNATLGEGAITVSSGRNGYMCRSTLLLYK